MSDPPIDNGPSSVEETAAQIRDDHYLIANLENEIKQLREEIGARNRLRDMDAGKGDFIAYADNRTFRRTDSLGDALQYAADIDGRVYERLASDAARTVCQIEEQQDKIKHLRAALRDCMSYVDADNLTMQTKRLRWQYVVDGGEWIKGNCQVTT